MINLSLTHIPTVKTVIKIYFILDFCFIYLAEERTDGCDEPADKRRKCGRDTFTQNTVPCDVTSSQTNNTAISVLTGDTEDHTLSLCRLNNFTYEICDNFSFGLLSTVTLLEKKKKKQATVGSWNSSLVETRLIKKQTKCPPDNIYVSLKCRR